MSDTIDAVAHAKALNEQRLRAWEEGKALLDEVAARPADQRSMSVEDTEKWNRINTEIDRLDAERDVYLTAERRQREAEEMRERDLSDFGEQRVLNSDAEWRSKIVSWMQQPKNTANGQVGMEIDIRPAWKEANLRRAGMDYAEARALAWDTGSVASAVPITVARSLYQYLEASIAMFRMPTRKLPTAGGEVMYLPKLGAHAIATQVSGQGTTLAGTDPTFGRMQLDAYKYGELVKVASEVISDSGIDIVDFVLTDIGRALGRKIDTDLVVGTGSGQPNGVMTALVGAGTIATGGSLIDPTVEKLIDLQYSVNDEYRNGGNACWLMNDLTAAVVRKMRDGGGGTVGAFLWEPSLTRGIQGGQPDSLFGDPVYTDPNVASLASNAKAIAYGDFSAYYIRTVGNVQLERDDSRYFDTDEVGFRGKWRVDGDLIDTTAINVIKRSV